MYRCCVRSKAKHNPLERNPGAATTARKLHVLMLPFVAYGHMTPFVELSKRLSALGVQVSFVSTPLNIAEIRQRFAAGEVQLVELPLPVVQGLPPGHESMSNLPPHLTPLFKQAVRCMEKPFESLLQQLTLDCVIHDLLIPWMSSLRLRLNIPTVVVIVSNAVGTAYYMEAGGGLELKEVTSDDLVRPTEKFPSPHIFLHPFEASRTANSYKRDGVNAPAFQLHAISLTSCDAILVNSWLEIEGKFTSYLQTLTGKTVFPVGPLLPPFLAADGGGGSDKCIQWLEEREPSYVVYVSLGSECFPSKDDIRGIALGLEASQRPFLWVLRFPTYSEHQKDTQILDGSSSLPPGFESRTHDRGLVVGDWVNQMQILSHPSKGGFMTHCGWNSLMEGMSVGVPLIALPMQYEQPLSARLVVGELELGVEVERSNDGSLRREELAKAVRKAMLDDSEIRQKGKNFGEEMKTQILSTNGFRQKRLVEFVEYLNAMAASNA